MKYAQNAANIAKRNESLIKEALKVIEKWVKDQANCIDVCIMNLQCAEIVKKF